jgi:hypothetical protein
VAKNKEFSHCMHIHVTTRVRIVAPKVGGSTPPGCTSNPASLEHLQAKWTPIPPERKPLRNATFL